MTLKMTTAQVVETSVTVTNSSFQNYTHQDDHTTRTTDTPWFKPFTKKQLCRALQKLTVLSEAGHEAKTSTQGVGVRTRMLDGAVHPDEYRIQKKRKERF